MPRPTPLDGFKLPDLLSRFAALDATIPDFTVSYLGIDRVHEDCPWMPYAVTPPDLIQFAWTGGDGIHFGFLTDFGRVTDLGVAPIVCVSPSTSPAHTVVARNLADFLAALCLVKDGNRFDSLSDPARDRDDPWWREFGVDTKDDEVYPDQLRTAAIVKERLGLAEMADYHGYLEKMWRERNAAITLPTRDGLGVIGAPSSPPPGPPFDFETAAGDLAKMRAFLAAASREQKLAFCRDAQYFHSFLRNREEAVCELVADTLAGLGLAFESDRIRNFG